MWKVLTTIVLAIILSFWISSFGDWHIERNKYNKLPVGNLNLMEGNKYMDRVGLVWELQTNMNNIFHQPEITPIPPIPIPYPNVSPSLNYDENYPNLKFLSMGQKGDSYEAILQQDGTFLTTGTKQGTYNYSNPTGFWGYTKHAVLDVFPHFFNQNYQVK